MVDFLVAILLSIAGGNRAIAVILISAVPLIELKGGIPIAVKLGLSHSSAFWLAFVGSSIIAVPLLLLLRPTFDWLKQNKKVGKFFSRAESLFASKAKKIDASTDPHTTNSQINISQTSSAHQTSIYPQTSSAHQTSVYPQTSSAHETNAYHQISTDPQTSTNFQVPTFSQANKPDTKLSSLRQLQTNTKQQNLSTKIIAIFLFVAIPAPGTGVWTGSFIASLIGLRFWYALPAIVVGNLMAGSLILLLTRLVGEARLDTFLFVLFAVVFLCAIYFFYKLFTHKEGDKVMPHA